MRRTPASIVALVAAVAAVPALAHCGKGKTPEVSEAPRKGDAAGPPEPSTDLGEGPSDEVICDDEHYHELRKELNEMCALPYYAPSVDVPMAASLEGPSSCSSSINIIASTEGVRIIRLDNAPFRWGEGDKPSIKAAPIVPYSKFQSMLQTTVDEYLLAQELAGSTGVTRWDDSGRKRHSVGWALEIDRAVVAADVRAIFHALESIGMDYGVITFEVPARAVPPRDIDLWERLIDSRDAVSVDDRKAWWMARTRELGADCPDLMTAFSWETEVEPLHACGTVTGAIALELIECGCKNEDEILTVTHAALVGRGVERMTSCVRIDLTPDGIPLEGATWEDMAPVQSLKTGQSVKLATGTTRSAD